MLDSGSKRVNNILRVRSFLGHNCGNDLHQSILTINIEYFFGLRGGDGKIEWGMLLENLAKGFFLGGGGGLCFLGGGSLCLHLLQTESISFLNCDVKNYFGCC